MGTPSVTVWLARRSNFAKARVGTLQRYDCPPGFSPGSNKWPADRNDTNGVCGYGPMEEEWAQQREWMHPLPSWNYMNGWTKSAPRNVTAERQWNAFVHSLEDELLEIRAPQRPAADPSSRPLSLPMKPVKCGNTTIGLAVDGTINSLRRRPSPALMGLNTELTHLSIASY